MLLPTDARPGFSRELTVPRLVAPARLIMEVLREERVRVGGQEVGTTVVRLTASSSGRFSARMELTIWLARSSGLWVKERSASEARSPDGALLYESQYEATLQRLAPA